jgi:hypothetical protein
MASSSENGKLKNPTSCPTEFLVSNGTKEVLHARPMETQSKLLCSEGQSFVLSYMAYRVAGRNADVHPLAGKYCHDFPD